MSEGKYMLLVQIDPKPIDDFTSLIDNGMKLLKYKVTKEEIEKYLNNHPELLAKPDKLIIAEVANYHIEAQLIIDTTNINSNYTGVNLEFYE